MIFATDMACLPLSAAGLPVRSRICSLAVNCADRWWPSAYNPTYVFQPILRTNKYGQNDCPFSLTSCVAAKCFSCYCYFFLCFFPFAAPFLAGLEERCAFAAAPCRSDPRFPSVAPLFSIFDGPFSACGGVFFPFPFPFPAVVLPLLPRSSSFSPLSAALPALPPGVLLLDFPLLLLSAVPPFVLLPLDLGRPRSFFLLAAVASSCSTDPSPTAALFCSSSSISNARDSRSACSQREKRRGSRVEGPFFVVLFLAARERCGFYEHTCIPWYNIHAHTVIANTCLVYGIIAQTANAMARCALYRQQIISVFFHERSKALQTLTAF